MRILSPENEFYPPKLKNERAEDLPKLAAIGESSLLENKTLGILASRKCPGGVILRLFDLINKWRESDLTFVSGFHSPLEQEVFKSLVKSRAKFIICPARSLEKMRIKKDWQDLIEQKRLLILSPFSENASRQSAELARRRNEFVSQIAKRLLIIHASENSQLEKLAKAKSKFWTLNNPANKNLISLGGNIFDENSFA